MSPWKWKATPEGVQKAAQENQRLSDLIANRITRIERRHRLLKNHREPIASEIAHRRIRQIENVAPLKPHAASNNGCVAIQQSHDRQRRH